MVTINRHFESGIFRRIMGFRLTCATLGHNSLDIGIIMSVVLPRMELCCTKTLVNLQRVCKIMQGKVKLTVRMKVDTSEQKTPIKTTQSFNKIYSADSELSTIFDFVMKYSITFNIIKKNI